MSAEIARRVREYIDKYIDLNPRETDSMGMDEGYAIGSASTGRAITRIAGEKCDNDDYDIYMVGGSSNLNRIHFEVMHKFVASSISYTAIKDEAPSTLWRVYDENNTQVGVVTLRYDMNPVSDFTIGFGWSDGEMQAGFELEFNEAVRMLAIIHRRKMPKDSDSHSGEG